MRSNISVGLPIDLLCYERNSLKVGHYRRILEGDPYFEKLCQQWQDGLNRLLEELPPPEWKD